MDDFISPPGPTFLGSHNNFNHNFVGTIDPTYNGGLTSILLHDQIHQGHILNEE